MPIHNRIAVILIALLLALCPLAPAMAQSTQPAAPPDAGTGNNLLFLPLLNQAGGDAELSSAQPPSRLPRMSSL